MRVLKIDTNITQLQFEDMVGSIPEYEVDEIMEVYTFPFIEFVNLDGYLSMFGIVDNEDLGYLVEVYEKYNISVTTKDLTTDILTGNLIFCRNDDWSKIFSKSISEFRLNYCSIDNVLDKIIDNGIESLNTSDYSVLSNIK